MSVYGRSCADGASRKAAGHETDRRRDHCHSHAPIPLGAMAQMFTGSAELGKSNGRAPPPGVRAGHARWSSPCPSREGFFAIPKSAIRVHTAGRCNHTTSLPLPLLTSSVDSLWSKS